jgi:hypothetical protein
VTHLTSVGRGRQNTGAERVDTLQHAIQPGGCIRLAHPPRKPIKTMLNSVILAAAGLQFSVGMKECR